MRKVTLIVKPLEKKVVPKGKDMYRVATPAKKPKKRSA